MLAAHAMVFRGHMVLAYLRQRFKGRRLGVQMRFGQLNWAMCNWLLRSKGMLRPMNTWWRR